MALPLCNLLQRLFDLADDVVSLVQIDADRL